jgi:GAF domain-containing protein
MQNARSPRGWVESLDAGAFHGVRAMEDAAAAPLDLALALAELARELYAADTVEEVLERVLRACTEMLDGCSHAAISLRVSRGRIETPAWTDDLALTLDELQYSLSEGPCVQAIRDERSFSVPDLANDPRFPNYGPRASRYGVGSMLACRLFTDERTIAALNLYGPTPGAFTQADDDVAALLAAHAAVAIDTARNRANLQEAVQTRQVIGEAIGILKERYGIDSDEAFRRLTAASQHLNVKLRVIAAHLSKSDDTAGSVPVEPV